MGDSRDTRKGEFWLKNYLNKKDIYKDNSDMQTVIINSFFGQCGGDNDAEWDEKIKFCQDHFGKFCQYAQNNWKHKK